MKLCYFCGTPVSGPALTHELEIPPAHGGIAVTAHYQPCCRPCLTRWEKSLWPQRLRIFSIGLYSLAVVAGALTLVRLWQHGFPRLEGPAGQSWTSVAIVLAPYVLFLLAAAALAFGASALARLASRRLQRLRTDHLDRDSLLASAVRQQDSAVTTASTAAPPLLCPNCGAQYFEADYRPAATAWLCSACHETLPRTVSPAGPPTA